MATSGSFNTGNYEGRYLTFSWSQTGQSVAGNYTDISWTLKGGGDALHKWYYAQNIKVIVDGETVYNYPKSEGQVTLAEGTVVATGTKRIYHNPDGGRSFTAYAEAGIYVWAVNCTGSGSWNLNTIARTSKPTVSASSVQMGNSVTITTNRQADSLTHTLHYSFGGATGTIATGVGASYKWSVPDLASKISGKTSGTCTITCHTYSGTTLIGSEAISLTLTVQDKSTPTVSASTVQMGKSVTVSTNRKSSGFTHTITYSVGSTSGTIGTGVTTSVAWTPSKELASYTGNKTSVACTITCKTYNGSALIGEATQTITLTVPNATVHKLSASTVVMGNSITISMSKEASTYTHDLTYAFAGTTGTIATGVSDDYVWTVPLSLAAKIPSKTNDDVTVTCTTRFKNSTTVVGTNTKTFKTTVPNNTTTQPKVTMTTSCVTDLPSKFAGIYVQGKTKVKVSYSASTDYSTINSYSTSMLSETSGSNPYTSGVLTTEGKVTITGKVTDKRGYSTTKTASITVVPHSRPRIIPAEGQNHVICTRCNSDGTVDAGGAYLLIKIGRKYSKVESGGAQKNFCKLSYRHKTDAADESGYSNPVTLLAANASTDYVSVVLPSIVPNNTIAYTIQLIAEDDVGDSDVVTITIPTAFVTWHSPVGGHGFTLGGYHDPAKYDVFDCIFDAEFEGSVSGQVLGLGKLPRVPENSDINDFKSFGAYAIAYSSHAKTMKNLPAQKAGVLRVWSANGIGVGNANQTTIYIMQEYIPYDNSGVYRRSVIYSSEAWSYGDWK